MTKRRIGFERLENRCLLAINVVEAEGDFPDALWHDIERAASDWNSVLEVNFEYEIGFKYRSGTGTSGTSVTLSDQGIPIAADVIMYERPSDEHAWNNGNSDADLDSLMTPWAGEFHDAEVTKDPYSTAIHEIGHALGFVNPAVMNAQLPSTFHHADGDVDIDARGHITTPELSHSVMAGGTPAGQRRTISPLMVDILAATYDYVPKLDAGEFPSFIASEGDSGRLRVLGIEGEKDQILLSKTDDETQVSVEYRNDSRNWNHVEYFPAVSATGVDFFNTDHNDVLDALALTALAGDFDASGDHNARDIDSLSAAIRFDIVFSQNGGLFDVAHFDLNGSGIVDGDDRDVWITGLAGTTYGDANLDGKFDSADIVAVFIINQYEDNVAGNSGWAAGDWNGDGDFTTADLVAAFQTGQYENT